MLDRFYVLRTCILEILLDLKENITLKERELVGIFELISALESLKVILEAICRRDATLLTADAALNVALDKLNEGTTRAA